MDFIAFNSDTETKKAEILPRFCPHPHCPHRGKRPTKENWCRKIGFFKRENGEKVQRWLCRQGEKSHTFSDSAFECEYWLKNRGLIAKIAQNISEQSSLRGLARTLGVSQTCIYTQTMRIGRHCLLLNELARKAIDPKKLGTIVFDELESWEVSQFSPTTHPMFMDFESGYKLELFSVPIRRKGKKTKLQERKYEQWRKTYGLVPSRNARTAIENVVRHLKPITDRIPKLQFATDEKKMYSQVLGKFHSHYEHLQYHSKINRNVGHMGKINQEDQYLRQRCSTMRRETLDSMNRHVNTSLRHNIYMVKRNLVQAASGTKRRSNPGVKLGLIRKPVRWEEVFKKRVFFEMRNLPEYLRAIYFQLQRTLFTKEIRFTKTCLQYNRKTQSLGRWVHLTEKLTRGLFSRSIGFAVVPTHPKISRLTRNLRLAKSEGRSPM